MLIRRRAVGLASSALVLACAANGAFALQLKNARIDFAAVAEAKQILGTSDDFTTRLTPFERSVRMRLDRQPTEQEFLSFARESALAWNEQEQKRISIIAALLNSRLSDLPVPLPSRILLIKTDGREEGESSYTRGLAIVISKQAFEKTDDLEWLICHELFHIVSKQNPTLREQLYSAIGFEKCNEALLTPDLEARRITNPDAPHNDHFIKLTVAGNQCVGMPLVLFKETPFDAKGTESFFGHAELRFFIAEKPDDFSRADAPSRSAVAVEEISGFFEQIGRNSNYIIHPEEILAENFARLVLARGTAHSPEVLEKIKAILLRSSHL